MGFYDEMGRPAVRTAHRLTVHGLDFAMPDSRLPSPLNPPAQGYRLPCGGPTMRGASH
jgi:hypothetical protein